MFKSIGFSNILANYYAILPRKNKNKYMGYCRLIPIFILTSPSSIKLKLTHH